MQGLPEFLDTTLAGKPLESTPHEAYRVVGWLLRHRLDEMQVAVWEARKRGDRTNAAEFFDLCAKREQLLEDIEVVEALLRRLNGQRPVERPEPKRRDPRLGYGER